MKDGVYTGDTFQAAKIFDYGSEKIVTQTLATSLVETKSILQITLRSY